MRFIAALLVAGVTFSPTTHARVLDDFSQGTIAIAVTGQQEASDVSSGLDPTHTIGGERNVAARGATSIRINSPLHPGEIGAVFPLGIIFPPVRGEFTYGANSPLGVNLNDDGAKAFRVHLQGKDAGLYFENAELTVIRPDGTGGSSSLTSAFRLVPDTGSEMAVGLIPFSDFGDLSNISTVALRFHATMPPVELLDPFVFSVRSFVTVVPEPAVGVMAMRGAIAITSLRHPSRI